MPKTTAAPDEPVVEPAAVTVSTLAPAAPVSAVDDLTARRDNYATFVAREVIFIGGARAYNVGDAVSTASIDDGTIPRELVVERDSDEGKRLLEQ